MGAQEPDKKYFAMSNVISKAKEFATQAHQRIGHRRKYTKQPYEVHLKAVANIVASVTEDEAMIAAAWLHDTVEDTSATHHDIEEAFGNDIAGLVHALTDISRPSDGNRAVRKAIDRQHLATASDRAKTIKLADLIDNTRDICKHDARFAQVYLLEANALIEVLKDGDDSLYLQAKKTLAKCAERLGLGTPPGSLLALEEVDQPRAFTSFSQYRVQRLFTEAFIAKDIAEPLRSFDADRPAAEVQRLMGELELEVIGVRHDGFVAGYAWKNDLVSGNCGDCIRGFSPDQVISGDATLSEAILILTRHDHCFVSVLDGVGGLITRGDIEKPVVRMWLFGVITMLEMDLAAKIRRLWPDGSWTGRVSDRRMRMAADLLKERKRRGQHTQLLDCLQLSDKAKILLQDAETVAQWGFSSRSEADRTVRNLESLRNNLAHSQEIATYDWPQIVKISQRIEKFVANT